MVLLFSGKQTDYLASLRHSVFKKKVVSASSFVAPARLPPTASATKFHSLRAYYQIMTWLGLESNLDATDWGWKIEDNQFAPVMTAKNPAPDNLLKIVHCNCTIACTTQRCTCRRYGLPCTSACGQCQLESCENPKNFLPMDQDDTEDTLGYGVLCIILVAVAQQLGGILQAALSVFGMIGGPLLGVFTLGIFFPHANSKRPPISVAGCPELYLNVSGKYTMESFLELNKTIDDLLPASKNEEILYIYRLSYLWLSAIAVVVVLIVGLLVSFITGRQDPKKLNPMLISPVFDILCCCLPGPLSERLGCHVGDEFNETQEMSSKSLQKSDQVRNKEEQTTNF
ncbi:Sodium-dependent multivitamin transporter [Nymphon striatum]|nr:Sodium-dependent multivitamin transporter [Nymphon striatum]